VRVSLGLGLLREILHLLTERGGAVEPSPRFCRKRFASTFSEGLREFLRLLVDNDQELSTLRQESRETEPRV
jgi:hypothetical protein